MEMKLISFNSNLDLMVHRKDLFSLKRKKVWQAEHARVHSRDIIKIIHTKIT